MNIPEYSNTPSITDLEHRNVKVTEPTVGDLDEVLPLEVEAHTTYGRRLPAKSNGRKSKTQPDVYPVAK